MTRKDEYQLAYKLHVNVIMSEKVAHGCLLGCLFGTETDGGGNRVFGFRFNKHWKRSRTFDLATIYCHLQAMPTLTSSSCNWVDMDT